MSEASPSWWSKPRTVTVCVDTVGWFDPFAAELVRTLSAAGDEAVFVRNPTEVPTGDVAFYLSCTKLTPPEILSRNRQNIIVHASPLPKGRGFSPVVWQILEGKNEIPVTMITAAEDADAGHVLLQDRITLTGYELNAEMREALGAKIRCMCVQYLSQSAPSLGEPQVGDATWYRRRTAEDSRLDPYKTIADQFELLRVVDNHRYPAFFEFRGRRYLLKIEPAEETGSD